MDESNIRLYCASFVLYLSHGDNKKKIEVENKIYVPIYTSYTCKQYIHLHTVPSNDVSSTVVDP